MLKKDPILSHDPTGDLECHRPDDRFIPVRSCEVAAGLAQNAQQFGTTSETLMRLFQSLEDVVTQEVNEFERLLVDTYDAFNPDRDTIPRADVEQARSPQGYRDLFARLDYLMIKANSVQLTEAQIQQAIETANSFGLRVRLIPERLAHLRVYVRGRTRTRRTARSWRHPLRGESRELDVYRRLVVITQLIDDPCVHLKLFKEIPTVDVEALLPHADVQMTWFDQLKVFGGGAGMVGSTTLKVFKLFGALVYWSRLLWVVLAGAVVLTYRALTGYRHARRMRDALRTKHLYYQNLDSNVGVIHSLCSMISQEEVKEALLAYCFCLGGDDVITDPEDLRRRTESYLNEEYHVQVNFDVEDALETLTRLGLWSDEKTFRVLDPETAARQLREHWQQGRSDRYHDHCALGHLATSGETGNSA